MSALRILIAEDNAVNQKVAVRLLDRLGLTADIASDGAEALAAVQRQDDDGRPYDVVLMDVQMPTMDGLEATRAIRARPAPAHQPVILALTANAMEGDRERCLAAGCDGYIPKPIRREDLVAALAAVMPSGTPDSTRGTGSDRVPFAQIVYASAAVRPFSPDELAGILERSRANNAASGITGAILYDDGNVMQVLEGPPEVVEATFRRVRNDPRHRSLTVLLRSTVVERTFPCWAMGVRSPTDVPAEMRDEIHSLFDLTRPGPVRAQRLLASFRGTSAAGPTVGA